jgi:SEC-C motif domain protein
MVIKSLCACGSQVPLVECCQPYLDGQALAPTAEALMRSRYTAFCQGNVEYLIATHQRSRSVDGTMVRAELLETIKLTRWTGLTIVATQKGKRKDKQGIVEFIASCEQVGVLGQRNQLHERSRFVKVGDRWLYVDGDIVC